MKTLGLLIISLTLLGCYADRASRVVRTRHAGEFGCPVADVKVTPLDFWGGRGSLKAEGCGRTAVYVCQGTSICIRNSAAEPQISGSTQGTQTPAAAPQKSTGERLRELDDLHDKQLISDEEYQERRRAILDSI